MKIENMPDKLLSAVNTYSSPCGLKITDLRVTSLVGAPMPTTLIKIETNQGITGFGEVRDFASRNYVLMLKRILLGENPCNVDKLFRRIKQFGGPSRQAGGVCAAEIALWDIVGKAFGVPVYQLLGGKFRDKIRLYCDTHVDEGVENNGENMGKALKEMQDTGFTFLKTNLYIDLIKDIPGALSWPDGVLEEFEFTKKHLAESETDAEKRFWQNRNHDIMNIEGPFTGLRITEKGLDLLEEYISAIRGAIGWKIPLAVDHIGHVSPDSVFKLAKRIEKYSLAWLEDPFPWYRTDLYARLSSSCAVPIATGEDMYLKESFKPLLKAGGVSVIHTDLLTSGGILENKKIGDLAQEYGVPMAIHMAETPVTCLAAVHSAAATENFMVQEFHASEVAWWNDMVVSSLPKPLVQGGYITVPDKPGLGIEELNDEILREHLDPRFPVLWADTGEWDNWYSRDRLWS